MYAAMTTITKMAYPDEILMTDRKPKRINEGRDGGRLRGHRFYRVHGCTNESDGASWGTGKADAVHRRWNDEAGASVSPVDCI